ncbi:MAG TPA: dimethylamine monooxygenase subunit DmmA family protein [Steroidobacteraceae bacterium]|nr:dimethylamine monooxygenase subunit DmmA family protein [Steroidobacteraceae bacterium]
MLITGIKSKPVYAPLRADLGGRYHLMLGRGPGADALLRVLAEIQRSAPPALQKTRVLLVPDGGAPLSTVPFDHLGLGLVSLFSEAEALLQTFRLVLGESLMGTRLYVAGPESFIGLAMKIALEFDLNKDEIRAEEVGTLARRVYCIHCRATTESVRTNIVNCSGCARWLLVRDHYSRRLAAYMGVMVDAEAPGELPPIKEVYL